MCRFSYTSANCTERDMRPTAHHADHAAVAWTDMRTPLQEFALNFFTLERTQYVPHQKLTSWTRVERNVGVFFEIGLVLPAVCIMPVKNSTGNLKSLGVRLDVLSQIRAGNWEIGYNSKKEQEIFILSSVQTGPRAHPASCLIDRHQGALCLRIKTFGRKADHSGLVSRLRIYRAIPSYFHISSWHGTYLNMGTMGLFTNSHLSLVYNIYNIYMKSWFVGMNQFQAFFTFELNPRHSDGQQ
jgi:hypothetical protein